MTDILKKNPTLQAYALVVIIIKYINIYKSSL